MKAEDCASGKGYGMVSLLDDGTINIQCPRCVTQTNLYKVIANQSPSIIDVGMQVPILALNMTTGMKVARTSACSDPQEVLKAVAEGNVHPSDYASDPMMILQFVVDEEVDHGRGGGPKTLALPEDQKFSDRTIALGAIAMTKNKSIAVAIRILHEWLPLSMSKDLMKLGELAVASKEGLREAHQEVAEGPKALLEMLLKLAPDSAARSMVKELMKDTKSDSGLKHELVVADSPEGAVEGLKELIRKIESKIGKVDDEDEDEDPIGFLSGKKGGGTVH
jgi:hypothetical protein